MQGNSLMSLLPFLIILLLFVPLFLNGRKQRRLNQERQDMQDALEVGDDVYTTSGLRGRVADVSYTDTIDLEIADGVVTTWKRAAVLERVPVQAPGDEADEEATADADDADRTDTSATTATTTGSKPIIH